MTNAPVAELVLPTTVAENKVSQPVAKETTASSAGQQREHLKLADRKDSTNKEQDVGLATVAIIGEKGNSALKKHQVKNAGDLADDQDKPEAPIMLFSHLLRPDFGGINMSDPDKPTITGQEGIKIIVNEDGTFSVPQDGQKEEKSIVQIFERKGQFFSCDLGDGKTTMIPIETVLSADVVAIFSDEQAVQNLAKGGVFSAQEIEIIKAYVDSVTGKGPQAAEKIDGKTLKEAALASGQVPGETLKTFTDANVKLKEINPTKIEAKDDIEKAKLVAENTAYNQNVEKVLKMFEGRVVAPPEAVAAVIQMVLPEGITKARISLEMEIAKLAAERAGLKVDDPQLVEKGKALDKRQEAIDLQEALLKQAGGFIQDGEVAVMEVFGGVQRGEIGVETIQALNKGLATNSPQEIITALLNEKKVDEATKEQLKKIDFRKLGKIGGGISLGIFFMLIWKALKGEGGMMGMAAAG